MRQESGSSLARLRESDGIRNGRLFRKYAMVLVGLVGLSLIGSGLVQNYLDKRPPILTVLYFCNPLMAVVEGMHRSLYGVGALPGGGTATWDMPLGSLAMILVAVLVGSMIFLRFTWGSFFARSGDFAEEL